MSQKRCPCISQLSKQICKSLSCMTVKYRSYLTALYLAEEYQSEAHLTFIKHELVIKEFPALPCVCFVNCTLFSCAFFSKLKNDSAQSRPIAFPSYSTRSFDIALLLCLYLGSTVMYIVWWPMCICSTSQQPPTLKSNSNQMQFTLQTCELWAMSSAVLIAACDVFTVLRCWWSAGKVVLHQPRIN